MLTHLFKAIQPAGLVLIGMGLVSLIFSEKLASWDSIMDSMMVAKVDPEYSRKWVEVSGMVWSLVGLGLLFVSLRFH